MLSPLEHARDSALADRVTEELYMVADDIVNPDPLRSPIVPTCDYVFAKPPRWRWRRREEYLNFSLKPSRWAVDADRLPRYFYNVCIGFFFWPHWDARGQPGTPSFTHPWH